ncbi:hypothetical protein Tco_0452245 [Tanacetum coccineum]
MAGASRSNSVVDDLIELSGKEHGDVMVMRKDEKDKTLMHARTEKASLNGSLVNTARVAQFVPFVLSDISSLYR